MNKDGWFKDWLEGQLSRESQSPSKFFFEAFVSEIVQDPQLDKGDLEMLADPIGATHTHQSEMKDRQHSFFYLLGDDYSEMIRPAYERVVKKFTTGKNQKPIVDLDQPQSRGLFKELYNIYDRVINEIVEKRLKD